MTITFEEHSRAKQPYFYIRNNDLGGGLYCPFENWKERNKIADVLIYCGGQKIKAKGRKQ